MESKLKMLEGLKPSKTFHQLGILVLDGSGSMLVDRGGLALGEMVNIAVRNFIDWFMTHSRIKQNISLAVLKFDDGPAPVLPTSPLTSIDPQQNWNPTVGMQGNTYLGRALEMAAQIANEHLGTEEKVEKDVVIVVLSDGMSSEPEEAKAISERIKSNPRIEIACSYFSNPLPEYASDAPHARALLTEVASTSKVTGTKMFTSTSSIDELRKFFIASLSTSQNGAI
jgi:uncharacterized protein YegL